MRLAALSIAFLFGSYISMAQTAVHVPLSSNCPVSMHLNRVARSAPHLVRDGQRSMESGMRLHLILSRSPRANIITDSIRSAEVTVHGYNSKPGFEFVAPGDTAITQHLRVQFTSAVDGQVSSVFAVAGLTSASWLEIDSLTLAHGNIWERAQGETCAVTPAPATLVK
ncbi:MAG: hypothetical protein ACRD25_05585 [Terracidiphilus sp.]